MSGSRCALLMPSTSLTSVPHSSLLAHHFCCSLLASAPVRPSLLGSALPQGTSFCCSLRGGQDGHTTSHPTPLPWCSCCRGACLGTTKPVSLQVKQLSLQSGLSLHKTLRRELEIWLPNAPWPKSLYTVEQGSAPVECCGREAVLSLGAGPPPGRAGCVQGVRVI